MSNATPPNAPWPQPPQGPGPTPPPAPVQGVPVPAYPPPPGAPGMPGYPGYPPPYPPMPPKRGMPGWAIALIICGVAVPVLALCAGMLLPALGAARRTARRMENDTRVRGVHQACVTWANGSSSFYPGLGSDGSDGDLSIEARYGLLLQGSYFTPEFVISPLDYRQAYAGAIGTGPVATGFRLPAANYSYAMLQVPPRGERRREWQDTVNTEAAVIADRDTGGYTGVSSYHGSGGWKGSVAFNDNHVTFLTSKYVTDGTRYGTALWSRDNLWGHDDTPRPEPGIKPFNPNFDAGYLKNDGN